MFNNGELLITGGAGYIGSILTRQLLAKNYRVRILDRLLFGRRSLEELSSDVRLTLIEGDIRDAELVRSSLNGVFAVVHLAAIVGEPACDRNPREAEDVNRRGSEILCDEALKQRIGRFVFASTCSNYGRMSEPDGLIDETAELQPLSVYSQSKVGFERHLLNISLPDFHPTCLRFATAYGLSPRPRFDLTLNEFTRELALGRTLEVYGEQFWRPYCHAADLARACVSVIEAEHSTVAQQAFNVGDSHENYQKQQLVKLIDQQIPGAIKRVKFVKREIDLRDYRVSFNKIRTRLGFAITRRVPDGIAEMHQAIVNGDIANPDDRMYSNV